jgi:hypothetical protein
MTNSEERHEAIGWILGRFDELWHAIVRTLSIQAPLCQSVPAQIALAENSPAKKHCASQSTQVLSICQDPIRTSIFLLDELIALDG